MVDDKKGNSNITKVWRAGTRRGWTVVDNKMVEDGKLTAAAKGIFLYLWSRPGEGWIFQRGHCLKVNKGLSNYALSAAVKDLQIAGYLLIEPVRGQERGRWAGWRWTITDRPRKTWAAVARKKFKVKEAE